MVEYLGETLREVNDAIADREARVASGDPLVGEDAAGLLSGTRRRFGS